MNIVRGIGDYSPQYSKREVRYMAYFYTIYNEAGIPVCETNNEVEAAYLATIENGYYI